MSSKFETFKTVGGNPDAHYAILRVAKLKTKGSVAAALSHNLRERETPNADKERFHENIILKGADTVQDGLQAWDACAPEKVRINARHHTIKEYYARAQIPLKDDLKLSERRVEGDLRQYRKGMKNGANEPLR